MRRNSGSRWRKPTPRSRSSCGCSLHRWSRAWPTNCAVGRARRQARRACRRRSRISSTTPSATRKPWSRRSASCSAAIRAWRSASSAAHSFPKGRASSKRSTTRSHAAFGALGTTEQARYLASLYVDDLADVWRLGIDPRFELARYGERLAASAATFDPLHEALTGEPTLVDATLDEHHPRAARRASDPTSSRSPRPSPATCTARFAWRARCAPRCQKPR